MQSDFNNTICALSKIYGIVPENEDLFRKALTHGSYTKENNLSTLQNYERLEFLGDKVEKLILELNNKKRCSKSYYRKKEEIKEYIEFIEKETNVPIKIVSVGPDRNNTIFR